MRSLTTHPISFNTTFLNLSIRGYTTTLSPVIKFHPRGTFSSAKTDSSIFNKKKKVCGILYPFYTTGELFYFTFDFYRIQHQTRTTILTTIKQCLNEPFRVTYATPSTKSSSQMKMAPTNIFQFRARINTFGQSKYILNALQINSSVVLALSRT